MKLSFRTPNWKKRIRYIPLIIVACYFLLCFSQKLSVRDAVERTGDCKLYYIVNVDGMKGLGHSILLLLNEQGEGIVLSYNGMQRSLGEALLGQTGVGKLSVGNMNPTETISFLSTGNLDLEGDQLDDNYDIALYRAITQEEYQTILALIDPYVQTAANYEHLYASAASGTDADQISVYREEMEQMAKNTSLPLYNIYTHNCDHAARSLAAAVDTEMAAYNTVFRRLTPNGNLKAFARRCTDWGILRLGETSLSERILEFLIIF